MLYKVCKLCGFRFKINFTVPFDLSVYLRPRYDWKISEDEISLNKEKSVTVSSFVTDIALPQYADTVEYCGLDFHGLYAVAKNFSKNYEYILFYTNRAYSGDDYGALFYELFDISPELQNVIDFHRNKINNGYVTAAFRLQSLLGDFDETCDKFPTLPVGLQDFFMQRNISHLIKIHEANKGKKVLVCSDSEKFINAAAAYDFVYAIDGKRQHSDVPEMEKQCALLTFVDFFMISYSDMVYLVIDGIKDKGIIYESYNSGFSRWASRLRNIKFIIMDYRPFAKLKKYKNGIMRRLYRFLRWFQRSRRHWQGPCVKSHSGSPRTTNPAGDMKSDRKVRCAV